MLFFLTIYIKYTEFIIPKHALFTHHIHIPALSSLAVDSYKSSSFVVIAVRMHACEYSMIYLVNSFVVGIAVLQYSKQCSS